MLRKVAGPLLLAFAVFYAITNPHAAADLVHQVIAGVGTFASSLAHGGHQ